FPSPEPYLRVSWGVIAVTVLTSVGFCVVVVTKAITAHRRQPTTGREGMVGERGRAETAIAAEGKVFLRGEYWEAWSDEPISAGTPVEVVALEGLRVKVKKAEIKD
ncbi:MAG TPA: NfeD family protein, partial [Geobacteraceae bacterium]